MTTLHGVQKASPLAQAGTHFGMYFVLRSFSVGSGWSSSEAEITFLLRFSSLSSIHSSLHPLPPFCWQHFLDKSHLPKTQLCTRYASKVRWTCAGYHCCECGHYAVELSPVRQRGTEPAVGGLVMTSTPSQQNYGRHLACVFSPTVHDSLWSLGSVIIPVFVDEESLVQRGYSICSWSHSL